MLSPRLRSVVEYLKAEENEKGRRRTRTRRGVGGGDEEGGRGGEKGTRDADVFIVSARSSHLKCS
jgi:hypothetical protein